MEYTKFTLFILPLLVSAVFSANVVRPKIIGGSPIDDVKQYKYLAVIASPNFCTAFIVNGDWVATAAHCLPTAVAGITVVPFGITSASMVFQASEVVTHDQFNKTSLANDIGAVKLSGSLSYSDTIGSAEIFDGTPAEGKECYAIGLSGAPGTTMNYAVAKVTIKKSADCSALEGQICTATNNGGALSEYDVGSPLVCDGKIAGIAVSSNANTGVNFELYQNMDPVKNWLNDVSSSSIVILNPFTLLATLVAIIRLKY